MAKSVARPDYLTGPALSVELGELAITLQAGVLGLLFASSEALARIAEADCFVIDESVIPCRRVAEPVESIGDRLRWLGVREVIVISHRPSDEIARLAEEVGADMVPGGQSAVEKTGFIAQRQFLDARWCTLATVVEPTRRWPHGQLSRLPSPPRRTKSFLSPPPSSCASLIWRGASCFE